MDEVVNRWSRRACTLFVTGLGLLGCIDAPDFHQVGESTAQASDDGGTSTTTTTPPSSASPGNADAGDENDDHPSSYVPDGGAAGPGTTACGKHVCAVGNMCCKDKCKPAQGKC